MDLGDRDSSICILDDASGVVLEHATLPTSGEAFGKYFAPHAPMPAALETGTQSPLASRAVADAGHEVIVAIARQRPLIYGARHESDERDPVRLVRVARSKARSTGSRVKPTRTCSC